MAKKKAKEVSTMELINIGVPHPKPAVSIREMFEQMAQQEAEMIRSARERMGVERSAKRERAKAR